MINDVLTMIPGPTPVHKRIMDKLSRPTVSHVAPTFVADYKECLKNFKTIMRTENGYPFIIGGGGTLAMEMALVNVVRDEKILIISHGVFGDRFCQLADAMDIPYDKLEADWGQVVPAEELAAQLKNKTYAAVTITHVDTSSGSCSPVADYCEVLRGRDELIILDGVCASAGMDERFDDWNLDVLVTAPQKAFGAPPGLAMNIFSERALRKRKSFDKINSYYADILRWMPIMEDPGKYFSTSAVNELLALHEATSIIIEEGLENRFDRHRQIALAIRAGFNAMGFETFTSRECLADTLSLFKYPEGVDDATFRQNMARNKVVVAGCLGGLAGKAFRVGHMGNIDVGEVVKTIKAAEKSLNECGMKIEEGCGVATASEYICW